MSPIFEGDGRKETEVITAIRSVVDPTDYSKPATYVRWNQSCKGRVLFRFGTNRFFWAVANLRKYKNYVAVCGWNVRQSCSPPEKLSEENVDIREYDYINAGDLAVNAKEALELSMGMCW